jgi:hypothetical protein
MAKGKLMLQYAYLMTFGGHRFWADVAQRRGAGWW